MNTNLTIKNFRVFDENGVSFDVKPITILTGCNSSGKSSMIKAAFLLTSFLSQINKAQRNGEQINPRNYRLDFTAYPCTLLGNFKKVVHRGSSSHKITFEYTTYSRMLSKDVTVQLIFSTLEGDELNNGWLEKINMSTDEGYLFYSDKDNGSIYNFNLIKEAGLDFLIGELLAHSYCGLKWAHDNGDITDEKISDEDYIKQKEYVESILNQYGARKKDILSYVRTSCNHIAIVKRFNVKPYIISWSKENGSLFNIPVIEDLNKLSKAEIKNWMDNKISATMEEKEKKCTDIIIDDFISSDSSCFFEYFKKYENDYLEKFAMNKPFSLKQTSFLTEYFERYSSLSLDILKKESRKMVSFELLYKLVMIWNEKLYDISNDYYNYDNNSTIYSDDIKPERNYFHYMLKDLMTTFAIDMVMEILTPDWCANLEYTGPSIAKINRLYTLDTNDDFTKLIKKYFEKKRLFETENNLHHKDTRYEADMFMNKWLDKFGIGKKIILSTDKYSGLGVDVRLYKTHNDTKGSILADEGVGITQLFAILLQIETAILSAKGENINRSYGLDDLDGYDSNSFHYEINTIQIEEPEIHLHPSYQSKLADMLVEAYKNYNIHFIIETHSEYLIRRLQLLIAGIETETKLDKNDATIFYVYSKEEALKVEKPLVKRISICDNGYLSDTFGNGFFDEATKLSRKLM